ncbi:GNAT family N-acetyltransferase [Streptomyces sp. NBC_00859]|uniref:GNAT family N-acetyltransferase n=1 Tax=Streptomyces sp. NBC_00859 TaxID=2903682 RepID=UPI0038687723|nr:GNAT family N-acetyltransferase [Streptomyces sp. NBC_00859]
MAEVFMRRLTRWQAEQQREAVADTYVEAYRGPRGEEYHDRQQFLERFAEDMQRPGFDMMVADGPSLAGCAYGYVLERDGGLWRGFRGGLPVDIEELTASGQVFVLAELMVQPAYRRQRIATRLVDQLLVRSRAALVAALVQPENTPARSAMREWGWARFGDVRPREPRERLVATQPQPTYEAWSRAIEHAGSAG